MSDSLLLPEIEMLSVNSIEHLAEVLPRRTPFFTLFLAGEAPDAEPAALADLLRPLVESGLVYFCAWGQGCEELQDAVDLLIAQKEQRSGKLPYDLISTSHADESLGDAAYFFSTMALPSESEVFANFARYAVALGGTETARRLKQAFLRQGISVAEIAQ